MIERKIGETDASVFAILDGHGGEYAAVFAKDHLMERLRKKIEDAVNIATGKVSPPSPYRTVTENKIDTDELDEKIEDVNDIDEVQKSPNTAAERRNKLKKALSTDDDCNPSKLNCNQKQDAFLNKLSSIRLTKESLLKTSNKNAKPQEFNASHYVDKDMNVNFGKMITDHVLFTDYELIERAKKQVRYHLRFTID